MSENEEAAGAYRAEIASRNRRRKAVSHERKLTAAVVGLLGYSAFSNFVAGVLALGTSPIDASAGFVLGALYSLGTYRAWFKDDTRWWPVAIPAGLSLALVVLAGIGGLYLPGPFVINLVLLGLVPFRARAVAALAPDRSSELAGGRRENVSVSQP